MLPPLARRRRAIVVALACVAVQAVEILVTSCPSEASVGAYHLCRDPMHWANRSRSSTLLWALYLATRQSLCGLQVDFVRLLSSLRV